MRKVLNMNRYWRFCLANPKQEALYKQPERIDFYRLKCGYSDGYTSLSYNDADWQTVELPHDRLTEEGFCKAESNWHGGRKRRPMWYRKTFAMPAALKGKHFLLSLEGIAVTAKIYFNGALVGRSYTPYTEVQLDLTERMHFEKQANVLAIYADPTEINGWWCEGAGLVRPAYLIVKEPVHITHNGLWAAPAPIEGGNWRLPAETEAENGTDTPQVVTVKTTLLNAQNQAVVTAVSSPVLLQPGQRAALQTTATVQNPRLWDVESPHLYTLKAELMNKAGTLLDAETAPVGFRTVTFTADHGCFLNGRPLKIKGIAVHSDHACVGAGITKSVIEYRVKQLKKAGANAYRCAHHPHPREVYDACDKFGLLVLDENRFFGTGEDILNSVRQMVRRDRPHPCVFMYALFNEEPLQGSFEGQQIFKRLRRVAAALDSTRPFTAAMNNGFLNPDGVALCCDVTGVNYNYKQLKAFHQKYPNQPLLGTEEVAAMTTRGCYQSNNEVHELDCYREIKTISGERFGEVWRTVQNNEYISGMFLWNGFDYRGEAFPFEWPSVGSYFGIMDSCGFEKAGYFAVQACYSTVPVLHLEPHWNFKKGQTVFVRAFSNCEQVELLLNGQSLGKQANNPCTPLFWQVEFCPGTLLARGYNAGRCVITASRQTAQKAAKIVLTPVNPALTNSGEEVAIVNVHLADANGNPCPTENKKINFEAVGDGKILGVGNGNQNSHERDAASSRRLFNGRCQVMLKAAPGAKALALKAKCQGVLPATVTFNILQTAQPEYVPETYSRLLGGFVESNICFTQKPDPLMTIADREMNLFVPLVLNPTRFQPFNGSYKLYRTRLLFANDGQNRRCTLHFDELRCGAAEMYANGALVFSGGRILEQPVEVTFETGGLESMEFRILITASGVADCDGIRGFVTVAVE